MLFQPNSLSNSFSIIVNSIIVSISFPEFNYSSRPWNSSVRCSTSSRTKATRLVSYIIKFSANKYCTTISTGFHVGP